MSEKDVKGMDDYGRRNGYPSLPSVLGLLIGGDGTGKGKRKWRCFPRPLANAG